MIVICVPETKFGFVMSLIGTLNVHCSASVTCMQHAALNYNFLIDYNYC